VHNQQYDTMLEAAASVAHCFPRCTDTFRLYGHRYEIVDTGVSWSAAFLQASESECDGLPGHLLTLESDDEASVCSQAS
jgi:hypothetical protein